mmetsp:Transcript_7197/g.21225  ORF Transcript_7197/g.21225 Transcript_7197/m.21225 type:complete len:365 (-) Transcript_7197:33-1127(-)
MASLASLDASKLSAEDMAMLKQMMGTLGPMKQKGFVVEGASASLRTVDVPVPKERECVVRVLIAGVCNTDLEIMKGYMGFAGVVGHEFVGVCESAPASHQRLVGRRVVGEINLACGACGLCGRGGPRARNHCPKRTVLGILNKGGTYQERLTLPAVNLREVPDGVSSENACFAEPLAAAFRIVEQRTIVAGDRVAVVGDGKLGLLIGEVLGRHCASLKDTPRPRLFGRHASKMALLSPGAKCDVGPSEDALPANAYGFDVVVDATGSPAGLDLARQLCRTEGTLVLKSTCAAGTDFNTAPFVVDELRVQGSRCGPFDPAMELLKTLDLTPLITATFPFAEASAAVERAGQRGCLKVQIRISEDP